MKRILLSLLLILIWGAYAEAATTRYASTSGSINATCPIGIPCTLSHAMSLLTPGDTLYIRGGTYTGSNAVLNLPTGLTSGTTTISRYQAETVTLQPATVCYSDPVGTSGIIIDGIIFDGVSMANANNCFNISANNSIIRNVEIKNYKGVGILVEGSSTLLIQDSYFHDGISVSGDAPERWYGVYVSNGTDVTIDRNRFERMPGGGIQYYPGPNLRGIISNNTFTGNGYLNTSPDGAILVQCGGSCTFPTSSVTDTKIFNNVIYGNGNLLGNSGIVIGNEIDDIEIYNNTIYNETGTGLYIDHRATNVVIRNNSLTNNPTNFQLEGGAKPTSSNNLCSPAACPIGTNNVNANPRYVDAPNADFRLCRASGDPSANCTTVSPNIGAGIDLSSIFTTDIVGSTRAAPWDIGAHESGIGVGPNPDPEPDPSPILVAEYSCDNVVTDSSGNSNTGTLTNGATYNGVGKYSQACSLDGTNDFVSVADSATLDLTHGFTMMAWVKPSGAMTTYKSIMAKNYTFYLYASSEGYCGAGGILAGYDTGSASANACYSTPLTTNWTHVAATYDRTSIKIYINGSSVTTAAGSAFLPVGTGTFNIGATEFGEYFPGLIDEVRIYNYARSAAQVMTDMNTPINALSPATVVIKISGGSTWKYADSSVVKYGTPP